MIDDAQPSDVAPEVLKRPDILVIEAGVVNTPHIDNHFNFNLKNKHDNFCCMAELLILASHEWSSHYVINRASIEQVDEIVELAKPLKFQPAHFQNFNESISQDRLDTFGKFFTPIPRD